MSLINEALKKAQWQRNQEAGDTASGMDGAQIAKRKQPKSATAVLLIGSAGVVLVVLTAVITVFWFNRPASKSAVAPATPARAAAAPSKSAAGAPITVPPPSTATAVVETAPVAPSSAPARAPANTTPVDTTPVPEKPVEPASIAGTPATPKPAATAPAGPATTPATPPPSASTVASATATPAAAKPAAEVPAAAAPSKPAAPPDERVQAWVDGVKIAGVRASGTDSKVFMNDRLYRMNDIVNRTLNIRLSKVGSDSLTFTDGNGVTYVRNF